MYHIVLISEDRILLKKIYPMIEDSNRYCIHVVPFSMDSAETFRHYHADIVILDSEVFTPYESILKELAESQWKYSVILLCNNNEPKDKPENILILNKEKLSKENLTGLLESVTDSTEKEMNTDLALNLNWNGLHSVSVKPGVFHIVFVKTFGRTKITKSTLMQVERQLSAIASLQFLFNTDDELCFLLNRGLLKSDFNFRILTLELENIFNQNCAVLYDASINAQNILKECESLKLLQAYSFFFSGQGFNFSDIQKSVNFTGERILHEQCTQLLSSLLSCDRENSSRILRELYLHTIKNSISFKTVEYIRIQLNFFSYLFTGLKMKINSKSLEEEMETVLDSELFKITFSPKEKLPLIISETVIEIYNNWQSDISLEGIAKGLDRNKIYLNRIYKESFNLTILDTLQYLRLEHAKYYLQNTKAKVSEIAELTGFNDIGYFSKFFHHETGITALEYRQQKSSPAGSFEI